MLNHDGMMERPPCKQAPSSPCPDRCVSSATIMFMRLTAASFPDSKELGHMAPGKSSRGTSDQRITLIETPCHKLLYLPCCFHII